MYKKISFSFVISCISLSLFAQKPEPIIARVFYKWKYQYDTIHSNVVKNENFVLLLGKTASVYKSYDKMAQDSEMTANYKKTGMMSPPSGERASGDQLLYFFNEKQLYLDTRLLGNYSVEKKYEEVDWKIDSETKKIQNITCQKATGAFKGRLYTAWFNTDFPFHAGPWKLHGLPGLIISAYDQTGRIRFDFSGLQMISNPTENIQLNANSVKISWEDYEKVAKAYENDPQGMVDKRFNVTVTTSRPLPHRNLLAPNPLINFPLELPDKPASK